MSETNEAVAVLPVLDEVIGFMEQALKEGNDHQATITQLKAGLAKLQADQDRIVLEKVAAAKATFFDKAALDMALGKLEGMGIIDSTSHEKLGRRIEEDPNLVLPLLTKVAETLMSAPGEGSGIEKDASGGSLLDTSDADPDGWKAMAEGKTVVIRR